MGMIGSKEILMTVEINPVVIQTSALLMCDQAEVLYAGELEYEQGVGVTMVE